MKIIYLILNYFNKMAYSHASEIELNMLRNAPEPHLVDNPMNTDLQQFFNPDSFAEIDADSFLDNYGLNNLQDGAAFINSDISAPEDDEEILPLGCIGLQNLGNTCYMNASLQALSALTEFRKLLLTNNDNPKIIINNYFKKNTPEKSDEIESYLENDCFSNLLYKLFVILWGGEFDNVSPISLRTCIKKNMSFFDNNEQHDAQEFFCSLIDRIDNELSYTTQKLTFTNFKYENMYYAYKKLSPSQQQQFYNHISDPIEKEKFKGLITYLQYNKTYSHVNDLFQFMICSTVKCSQCKTCTTSYEPYIFLQLEIPEAKSSPISNQYNSFSHHNFHSFYHGNQEDSSSEDSEKSSSDDSDNEQQNEDDEENKQEDTKQEEKNDDDDDDDNDDDDDDDDISLKRCLYKYFKREKLTDDNQYFCSKCNCLVDARKTFKITKHPKILIIQFKRFIFEKNHMNQMSLDKNTDEVKFSVNLDINKYIDIDYVNVKYKLRSVINHEGRDMKYGHYTTYSFNDETNKWYYFNDANVSEEDDIDTIVDSDAYMLFYELVE